MAWISEAKSSRERSSPLSSAVPLTRVSAPRPSAPRGRKAPLQEGVALWAALLPHTPAYLECLRLSFPNIGGDGGSEVTKLPNPVCLYKLDICSPCAQLNHSSVSEGLWYRSKCLRHLSWQWKGSLNAHTHVCTHTHQLKLCPLLFFFYVALPCSNHFTLFSAIVNSFIPASSTTRESLEERAGVSSSPPG